MKDTAEIIIIGGGVIGASIAYHLARQGGSHVALIERRGIGTGTTGHSGAIVRQHYANDFTIRMARESLAVFEHFDERIGGNCGFVKTGMLVTTDEQGASLLQANVELQQRQGVNTRLISPNEISSVAPGYSDEGIFLACYEADAGIADSMATTQCFARRAREHGATIYEGMKVTRILTQHDRVTGVETKQGNISAPIVVLAANVWSVALAQAIHIALPITATRHPMVALRRPQEVRQTDMHSVCIDMAHNIYLRPEVGGTTLVGSTANILTASEPDHYALALSQEEIGYLSSMGAKEFPELARAAIRGGWAGLYDDTPDYHPILGPLNAYKGLYCAAGFSGHGFKLSPTIGKWMAQLITTDQAPTDMQPFAFERFAQGKQIQPRYASGGVMG
ncbi:FAD-binding oxidoreductase [Ktedonosporobacter rubrisoli]|uniref:FAD-binding oxidoreductase n=1 Tax=Ktedonosporobacter rubrisoli TaxID=2509675 RepID=A0A4P6K2C4_KTERU|nr:FAD-dependent oxidoreductase [Ktedonosporobacter rubrisoli]QBD82284.1 FAD-binding oxidoreductase [Ktedonosporobacter rubrisoli]